MISARVGSPDFLEEFWEEANEAIDHFVECAEAAARAAGATGTPLQLARFRNRVREKARMVYLAYLEAALRGESCLPPNQIN